MKKLRSLFTIGLMAFAFNVTAADPVYSYFIPIGDIPLEVGGYNQCIGFYDAKSEGSITNTATGSIWFQAPVGGTASASDTTPYPYTGRLRVIRRSNGQTVACGDSPVFWTAVANAEYKIDLYMPEAYGTTGSNEHGVQILFPDPANECPSEYEDFVVPLRPFDNSPWWSNPFAGTCRAVVSGYDPSMTVTIKVIRNDLFSFCAETNNLTFQSVSNKRYRFVVYADNIPPGGSPINFSFYEAPIPPFSFSVSGGPMPVSFLSTNDILLFSLNGPVHDRLYYQWYYSQTLLPLGDSGWIPHFLWSSSDAVAGSAWQVSHTTGPGYMSADRPQGFWHVRAVVNGPSTYDERAWILNPDEPIGYPPPPPPCTNNCDGDITPPSP